MHFLGMTKHISFEGILGAYSHLACQAVAPDHEPLPCVSFDDAFAAVREGRANLAMMPVENSIAGRVADMHRLLREGGLHIVGEHYQPVVHHLLAVPGAKLENIKQVHSHVQSLAQCRRWLRSRNIKPIVNADNALAAKEVAEKGDPATAAIASSLAGTLYGLQSLAEDIADQRNNTTRCLVMARNPVLPEPNAAPCITSMLFNVRSVPAALYKALGGFATNGINITKLESYLIDGKFTAAQFYLDVEGHPEERPLKLALEELAFFAHEIKVLGTYPASPWRRG